MTHTTIEIFQKSLDDMLSDENVLQFKPRIHGNTNIYIYYDKNGNYSDSYHDDNIRFYMFEYKSSIIISCDIAGGFSLIEFILHQNYVELLIWENGVRGDMINIDYNVTDDIIFQWSTLYDVRYVSAEVLQKLKRINEVYSL